VLQLDDTALQLYKGGDYGAYLDLEASINEQQEEFEGFHEGERWVSPIYIVNNNYWCILKIRWITLFIMEIVL